MASSGTAKRDFLSLWDLEAHEIEALLVRAGELKALRARGVAHRVREGRSIVLVFEKASTRTRVSFEIAMRELGGHAIYLDPDATQIGRGEPMRDTARVLGAYCHAIVIRTFAQERAAELARFAPVPVINALTDLTHPCQVLADLFTVQELLGDLRKRRYAWIGDGNNMAHAWIEAAGRLGLDLALACPAAHAPDGAVVERARGAGATIRLVSDPGKAAAGAHVLSTDVWASMGQEGEREARARTFAGYRIDGALLARAEPDAVVLHCLPAHRGEEIEEEVLEGPRSAVFRQAENRLHTQKALLEMLIQ